MVMIRYSDSDCITRRCDSTIGAAAFATVLILSTDTEFSVDSGLNAAAKILLALPAPKRTALRREV